MGVEVRPSDCCGPHSVYWLFAYAALRRSPSTTTGALVEAPAPPKTRLWAHRSAIESSHQRACRMSALVLMTVLVHVLCANFDITARTLRLSWGHAEEDWQTLAHRRARVFHEVGDRHRIQA